MVCLAFTGLSLGFNLCLQCVNLLHQFVLWQVPVYVEVWVKTQIDLALKKLGLELSIVVLDLSSHREVAQNIEARC